MKTSIALGLVIVATAMAAPQGLVFKDKAGNMELRNFTKGWKISRVDGTDDTYKFRAAGTPLLATWESQGLMARMPILVGTAKQIDKKLELVEATMSGGVHVTTTRKSGNKASKAIQTVTLDSDSLEFNGPKNQIDLKGGVVVNQNDPGTNQ